MVLDYTVPVAISLLAISTGLSALATIGIHRVASRLFRRAARPASAPALASLTLLAAGLAGAFAAIQIKGSRPEHAAVDLVMTVTPRPARDFHRSVVVPSPYLLLAGDLHCHVHPPDWSGHVVRGLQETIDIARAEGIDFITLMPHVYSGRREGVAAMLRDLQAKVDARPEDGLILDVGVEVVDPTGHFGMVLGDVPRALAESAGSTRADAFVSAFVDRGGLLVVHHPLLTPVASRLPLASLDISWQPFTGQAPYRPEIAAVDARAHGFEAANLFVRAVRDRFLLGDTEESTRGVLGVLDREIVARQRRMTAVGGTDSHSFHLRPMTFVLAEARSRAAIRDAIHAGRTCVVDPAACTFEARPEGGAFLPVGSSIVGARRVEVRATGRDITIYRDGERVVTPGSGQIVGVDVGPSCSVIRARVDGGYASPVYVNCPFAELRSGAGRASLTAADEGR